MAPLLFIMKKKLKYTKYSLINNPCNYISLISFFYQTSLQGLVFSGFSCKVLKTPFAYETYVYDTRNMRISDIKIQTMARYILAELPLLT